MARDRRRRQPLTYDSRTAGGLNQTNFGDLAKTFTQGQKYIREVAQKTDDKIQANIDSVLEATEYEHVGQADIDSASIDVMNGLRNGLFEERAKIGKNGYTIHDFNKVYNKTTSSAKSYGGVQKFVETQLDAINKNENLSGITKAGFINNIGAAFSKDGRYKMEYRQGDIVMTSYSDELDENGKPIETVVDMKRFLVNGQDEINKFDALGSVATVQKLYMDRVKTVGGVTAEEIEGLDGKWLQQITETTHGEGFNKFLDQHIENFAESDEALAYAYDTMGLQLGRDIFQKDGKFILNKEQKAEIGKNYRTMIEGQMGVKKTASGGYQALPRKTSGGSGKVNNAQSTYLYNPPSHVFMNNNMPASEIGYNRATFFAEMRSGYDETLRSTVSGEETTQKGFEDAVYLGMDTQVEKDKFIQQNYDLYSYRAGLNPVMYSADQLKFTGVGLSADMQSQDITELGINSQSGRDFKNISGMMIIEKPGSVYDPVTKTTPTEYSFRLSGSVTLEESVSAREMEKRGGQNEDNISIGVSENRSIKKTHMSGPLGDRELNEAIKAIKKSTPLFNNRYASAVTKAMQDGLNPSTPVIKRRIVAQVLRSLVNNPII